MKTIILVLRTSKEFTFRDVELIVQHIKDKWKGIERPRILCITDLVKTYCNLGTFELLPLENDFPGTWARMQLYSPEMEKYRPYLYLDLDTAVVNSIENIFDLITDDSKFIALEDFWQKGQLATGVVWFPKNCEKIKKVWESFKVNDVKGFRMDYFLRKYLEVDLFWQQITDSIVDFKPRNKSLLSKIQYEYTLVCFHGKPRIHEAAEMVDWVKNYVLCQ